MIGDEGSEGDMLCAGGGIVKVSACEVVGDVRGNGSVGGEKVKGGER